MSDSSAVDEAIIQLLAADAELTTRCPDGVHYDVAPPGSKRFVIVSLLMHVDEYLFNEEAWELFTYQVQCIELETSGASNSRAAAARIHALLQDAYSLAIDGYGVMKIKRIERIRTTDADAATDTRWLHRGGRYEVMVQPLD